MVEFFVSACVEVGHLFSFKLHQAFPDQGFILNYNIGLLLIFMYYLRQLLVYKKWSNT